MSVDWKEVHSILDAGMAALDREPSAEERKAVLLERARALAAQPPADEAAQDLRHLVGFVLSSRSYAMDYAFVGEIHPLRNLTPLPCAPSFILGLVNIRGRILPVIDLRILFDLPSKGMDELKKIIVLRSGEMEFGILADSIREVRSAPKSAISPPLATTRGREREYGIGILEDGAVLLDAKKILNDERNVVFEEVEQYPTRM